MKTRLSVLMIFTLLIVQACNAQASMETTESGGSAQVHPAVSTAVVSPELATLPTPAVITEAPASGNPQHVPEDGITIDDNGKTFTMHPGESVLLNLGTDVYEWTAVVENENVLHIKLGVMVIKGAQGIYEALAPGTTLLSASGNPLCLQSRPACARPSILFWVKVIVK